MPQLPIKQGTNRNFSPQSGEQRVNPQAAGADGRKLQGLGQSLQQIADTWKKAEVSTNYTTSRNSRSLKINQILQDAQNNPDSSSAARQRYVDQLNKMKDDSPQIGDERVQQLYDSESELAVGNAQLQVDQFYRQKMVSHMRVEIDKDLKSTQEAYNSTSEGELEFYNSNAWMAQGAGMSGEDYGKQVATTFNAKRSEQKAEAKEKLTQWFEQGFLSEKEYNSELEDMDTWEYARAMDAISKDPHATLRNIDNFDLNAKQRGHVIVSAQSTITKLDKINQTRILETQNENHNSVLGMVVGNDDMTNAEKELEINKLLMMNQIDSKFASNAIKVLNSETKVERQTSAEEFAVQLRLMQSVIKEKTAGVRDKDLYLKKVNQFYNSLLKSKKLSPQDKKSLLSTFSSNVGKTTSKAIDSAARKPFMKTPIKSFESMLPLYMQDEAILQYYRETEGKELSKDEEDAMILKVINDVDETFQDRISDNTEKALEKWGTNAQVEDYYNESEKTRYLLRIENGKVIDSIPLEKSK